MHSLKRRALVFLLATALPPALLFLAALSGSASAEPARGALASLDASPDARGGEGGARPRGVLNAVSPAQQGVGEMRIDKTPPDPDPPMRAEKQWVFDLRWERGEVFFLGVHPLDLGAPQATPRVMGRFALELFEGPTLIERVRFDFPMLGAGDSQNRGFLAPPSFERKLTTRVGVMFPESKRGTRLELWDRATNARYRLPWPPDEAAATGARTGDASACDGPCP